MKSIHAQRLMKLARFLYVLPKEKFDINTIVKGENRPTKKLNCGSTACAIGWCPVLFPKLVEYDFSNDGMSDYEVIPIAGGHDGSTTLEDTALHLFGMNFMETRMFDPSLRYRDPISGVTHPGKYITPKEMAKNIVKFVKARRPETDTRLNIKKTT